MEQAIRTGISPGLKRTATPLRSLGGFTAQDPWAADASSEFTIEEYELAQKVAGIAIEANGLEHFVPESLVDLWRSQKVPARHLPRLVYAIEPKLMREDCLLNDQRPAQMAWMVGGMMFVLALGSLRWIDFPPGLARPGLLASLGLSLVCGGCAAGIGASMQLLRRSRRRNQIRWALREEAALAGSESRGAPHYRPRSDAVTSQMGSWLRLYFQLLGFALTGLLGLGLVAYLVWG